MKVPLFHFNSTVLLLVCLFAQSLHCQQVYLNNVSDCSTNPSAPKGYLCNAPLKSCNSFLTFTSKPPYDTPLTIADLLGSEASTIASINNISNNDKTIPANETVFVPISCSCNGNIYQHGTRYTARKADTYFNLVKENYQGLTTCQALMGQNYFPSIDIQVGAELTVPLICACPTENQTAKGVTSLLAYIIHDCETVERIGQTFGVDAQSIIDANEL